MLIAWYAAQSITPPANRRPRYLEELTPNAALLFRQMPAVCSLYDVFSQHYWFLNPIPKGWFGMEGNYGDFLMPDWIVPNLAPEDDQYLAYVMESFHGAVQTASAEDRLAVLCELQLRQTGTDGQVAWYFSQIRPLEVTPDGLMTHFLVSTLRLHQPMPLQPNGFQIVVANQSVDPADLLPLAGSQNHLLELNGRLTQRELEILRGLAAGQTSRDIGQDLGISPNTVNNYRKRLMIKLRSRNTAEMIHYCRGVGLV
jgi:DNA-binding CsgD family transcriptional regulator